MSEQATAPAPTPVEQQQPAISFVFVITQAEANVIVQALDELPGKLGRPITQKMIMQSNQQPDLITNVIEQFQKQLAEQQTDQVETPDGLAMADPLTEEGNQGPSESPVVRPMRRKRG